MSNGKGKLYFGGIPVEPSVIAIRERYPDAMLKEGMEISYPELAKIIGSESGTSRFKTVTTAWRRKVEMDSGIIIGCIPGIAFKVLPPAERFECSMTKTRQRIKSVKRGMTLRATVKRVDIPEADRARYDHLDRIQKQILAAASVAAKTPLPSLTGEPE